MRVAKAQMLGKIKVYWIPGKDNPANLFTKEHKDLAQFNKHWDLMVRPCEWVHHGCNDDTLQVVPYIQDRADALVATESKIEEKCKKLTFVC